MTALAHNPADVPTSIELATKLLKEHMAGGFVESHVADLTDDELPRVREAVISAMRIHAEAFKTVSDAIVAQAKYRMIERKAKAIPDTEYEIALEDVYTEYARDVDAAIEAAFLLPEEEAAKVVKFVPERTEVVPAHHEVGNPISIAALRKKYAGSKVDELLGRALSRQLVDTKVTMVRRKGVAMEAGG